MKKLNMSETCMEGKGRFVPKGGQGIKADDRHLLLRDELLQLFKDRPMTDEEL